MRNHLGPFDPDSDPRFGTYLESWYSAEEQVLRSFHRLCYHEDWRYRFLDYDRMGELLVAKMLRWRQKKGPPTL